MTTYKNVWIGIVAVNLLAFFRPATGQMVLPAQSTLPSPEAREQVVLPAQYEGRWEVQANGDVKATRKYTLPMQMYRMWKAADAPMLEARSFSSGRSSLEVTGKKADWDDLNRTLIFTMTEMGAFQNKGDHWEGKMPLGHEFSNLDETRKIAFFHFTAAAEHRASAGSGPSHPASGFRKTVMGCIGQGDPVYDASVEHHGGIE